MADITEAELIAYNAQDAQDRRFAAALALSSHEQFTTWQQRGDEIYRWLRGRVTTSPHDLKITPGIPGQQPEGTPSP